MGRTIQAHIADGSGTNRNYGRSPKLDRHRNLDQRECLPELEEEDTYYWVDLIGLSVFAVCGEYLGRIHSIFPTGSNDVFVVKDENREILVPALASVVVDVDLEGRTVRVDLPEGL